MVKTTKGLSEKEVRKLIGQWLVDGVTIQERGGSAEEWEANTDMNFPANWEFRAKPEKVEVFDCWTTTMHGYPIPYAAITPYRESIKAERFWLQEGGKCKVIILTDEVRERCADLLEDE